MENKEELLHQWELELYKSNRAKVTKDNYYLWVSKMLDAHELTVDGVEGYLDNLKETKAPSTFNVKLSAMRQFCKWLYSNGYTSWDYTSKYKPIRVIQKDIKPFSKQEINKLRPLFNTPRLMALWVFLMVGLRKSELLNVKRSDIALGKSHSIIAVIGKGGKQRHVPVHHTLNDTLHRLNNEGHLAKELPLIQGWAASSSLGNFLANKGRTAGIAGSCNPHRFRHTYAQTLLDGNMPLDQIQQLLGHESVETTMRYIQVNKRKLLKTLSKIDIG